MLLLSWGRSGRWDNTASNPGLASSAGGQHPIARKIFPARVYVLNGRSNSVSVIDSGRAWRNPATGKPKEIFRPAGAGTVRLLERHESEMLERQATEGSVVVSKNFLRSQLTVHRFPSLPIV